MVNDSEDTLKQEPTLADIMNVLTDIFKRLNARDAQFEAIREGISHNASRFDRVEANIYSVRSDISNLKADIRDLSEEIRQKNLALK